MRRERNVLFLGVRRQQNISLPDLCQEQICYFLVFTEKMQTASFPAVRREHVKLRHLPAFAENMQTTPFPAVRREHAKYVISCRSPGTDNVSFPEICRKQNLLFPGFCRVHWIGFLKHWIH